MAEDEVADGNRRRMAQALLKKKRRVSKAGYEVLFRVVTINGKVMLEPFLADDEKINLEQGNRFITGWLATLPEEWTYEASHGH